MSVLTPNIAPPPIPGQDRAGGTATTWGLLAWLVAIVIWLTWAPFAARPDAASDSLSNPPGIIDFVGNLALFMPVAIVATAELRCPSISRWLFRLATTSLLVSITIETGQHFMAGRFVSGRDVVLNTAGAVLAAAAITMLHSGGFNVRRLVWPVSILVFLAVVSHMIASARLVAQTFRLAEWDPTFPVLAGNEVGGDRAYTGAVLGARLCAGAGSDAGCTGPGAELAIRRRLTDAAIRDQRVALTAIVVSERAVQTGPARIVTFSGSTDERNATLAQDGQTLVLRVRTPLSGSNGARIEFGLSNAVRHRDTTVVQGAFDRGTIELAAGSSVRRAARIRFGLFDAWVSTRSIERILPGHILRARLASAIILGAPLVLFGFVLTQWLTRRRRSAPSRARSVAATP